MSTRAGHTIGYRYWVDDANRLDGAQPHEGPPAEPGHWRVEVMPSAPASDYVLLHGIVITDTGAPPGDLELPGVQSDFASRGPALAVRLPWAGPRDRAVLLSGAVPRARVDFAAVRLPAGVDMVLTDLEPGGDYRAQLDGAALPPIIASAEGVASLAAGSGRLVIGRCPSPAHAGGEWQTLCAAAGPTPSASPTRDTRLGWRISLPLAQAGRIADS